MQKLVGIFRNKEDLERSLGEIDKAKKRLAHVSVEGSRLYNPGWHLALDLKSMLTVSEAVALSALAREESRGAHSRIDFQKLDQAWGAKNNTIQRDGEAMRLRQENVPEMPHELRTVLAEEKGETAHRG
jgi:succinate dehydrogenase / fumarate reductase flavoprotein subunit